MDGTLGPGFPLGNGLSSDPLRPLPSFSVLLPVYRDPKDVTPVYPQTLGERDRRDGDGHPTTVRYPTTRLSVPERGGVGLGLPVSSRPVDGVGTDYMFRFHRVQSRPVPVYFPVTSRVDPGVQWTVDVWSIDGEETDGPREEEGIRSSERVRRRQRVRTQRDSRNTSTRKKKNKEHGVEQVLAPGPRRNET